MPVQLCSLNHVKDALRIPHAETALDVVLTDFINDVSDMAEKRCNRAFTYAAVSAQKYNGKGQHKLALRNYPVDADAGFILQYQSTWNFSQLVVYDVNDFLVHYESGVVELLGGLRFPNNPGSVLASFSSGYQPVGGGDDLYIGVPGTLRLPVVEFTTAKWKQRQGALNVADIEKARDIFYRDIAPFMRRPL